MPLEGTHHSATRLVDRTDRLNAYRNHEITAEAGREPAMGASGARPARNYEDLVALLKESSQEQRERSRDRKQKVTDDLQEHPRESRKGIFGAHNIPRRCPAFQR